MTPFAGRPLPTWWSDAGLGILVTWGPYSVPAWAPVGPDPFDVAGAEGEADALRRLPFAEWYWNGLALEGSAVAAHHADIHAGSTYDDFAADFRSASASLDADGWVELFGRAGAGYVVLTAKHHDGFLLWDSATGGHPGRPGWQADVDLVGQVAVAARRRGLRFGAYYSGGLDWAVAGLGIGSVAALRAATPGGAAYAERVRSHWIELLERHRPDVLWNDIAHPGGAADAAELFERYYAAVPDGVVNDRFDVLGAAAGTSHADVVTPDPRDLSGVPGRPFEVCRALGGSLAWNRAEEDGDLLTVEELVAVLVDIRSRGGNLLLGIGPTAHGSIPRRQRERLEGLATWMNVAGEAVVGARPWELPALPTSDGRIALATTAGGSLYLTLSGPGGASPVGIAGLVLSADHDVRLLGSAEPLAHRSGDGTLVVELPPRALRPPVLRITPSPSLRANPHR